MIDPYRAAGLTRNPFAWTDDVSTGPFMDHLGLEPPKPGQRRLLQLIGDKGAGKTSHLRQWQRLEPGPYHRVELGSCPALPLGPLVYWDEINNASNRRLRRALRAAARIDATIVAGTHRDISALAQRCGLAVYTVRFEALHLDLLRRWVDTRLDAARDGTQAGCSFELRDEELEPLLHEPGASLRSAGHELHRVVAHKVRELAARAQADATPK